MPKGKNGNGKPKVDKLTVELAVNADLDTKWKAESNTPTPRDTTTVEEAQQAAEED